MSTTAIGRLFLAFDSRDTRQNLTLDSLKQRASACRYVRNLVGKTELVDTSHRVAAAYQRERSVGSSLHDGIGNGARAGCEVIELEHTCRTVPKDGLRSLDNLGESLARFRTGIETFPTVRNGVCRNNLGVGIVA